MTPRRRRLEVGQMRKGVIVWRSSWRGMQEAPPRGATRDGAERGAKPPVLRLKGNGST
jgi:hypothetical protein